MKEKCQIILVICGLLFIILTFSGCHQGMSDAPVPPTINPSLPTYEYNVELVKNVEGYTEADAKALMRVMEHLVQQGSMPNDRMVSAEKYVHQATDQQGQTHEDTYLRFVTEDGEVYYAMILNNSNVYMVIRGSLEKGQCIWVILE